ncbi:MAG: HAMP domain-containing sensor histidine kinase [Bacteroidales bacterium]|jgi:signal transduction histidine kinase|nr:HAMP domain-containing sensor histidine kinase [Bacteroidales bacterium]
MQKRTLWMITVVLSTTLIGLIFVQVYWIRNAIDIKQEQFKQLVASGLENIVKEIENREMVYQVVNEIEPYQDISISGSPSLNYRLNEINQRTFSLSTTDKEKEIFVFRNTDSLSISKQLQALSSQKMQFNNITSMQFSDLKKTQALGKLQITADFTEKLNNRTVFVENIVNKLIQIDVDLKDRIDQETVEKIIQSTFRHLGVDIPFEYAITRNDEKIVYQSENYSGKVDVEKFSGRLFPNDVFAKNNFLTIYFPDEKTFIFKSTGFMAFSSIFLTLVIILGFSLSIHIMFKQKRLSKIKNDFVNNMTHELKTPISTISLASQMLKDKSIPIEIKNMEYISNIIDDESKRLSYQVEKVLKTALFDQGQIKLKRKELDIHHIIENVVNNFEIQVKNRNGKIIEELQAKDPIFWVDEVHFTNIIFNLLDNAVKYSNGAPEITISTRNTREGVQLLIADRGIGIKKQDQKKVFDQFYRVSTGNVHDVKGFGLGLSYVKKIVEEHGGLIELESEWKKGTTFKIFIPNNHINNG